MATTLWSKFQGAVRWVFGTTLAAIATVQMAPIPNPEKVIDEATAITAAPSAATDGVSIEGIRWVDICYTHSDPAGTSAGKLWVYNGVVWTEYDTLNFDKQKGALNAFDSGSYTRLAIELTSAPSSGSVDVYVNTTNDES